MVKNFKNIFLQNHEADDFETWYTASGTRVLTIFHMMTLGWPWLFLWQGQICFHGWKLTQHWVLMYFQVCSNSTYPQHSGERYRTNGPLVFGVTCLLAMKNFPIDLWWRQCCPDDSDFTFDPIFVNLAGNQDRHKISDELRLPATSDYSRQSYLPLSAGKAHIWPCPIDSAFSFDRSSSNLQVTRTAINSRMSSNFGQIRRFT